MLSNIYLGLGFEPGSIGWKLSVLPTELGEEKTVIQHKELNPGLLIESLDN
jgi:hypothetical protein